MSFLKKSEGEWDRLKRIFKNLEDLLRLQWLERARFVFNLIVGGFVGFLLAYVFQKDPRWSQGPIPFAVMLLIYVILTGAHERYVQKQIVRFSKQLFSISKAVTAIVWKVDTDYHYEVCEFEYFVGSRSSEDGWKRHYVVAAGDQELLIAKDLRFGSTRSQEMTFEDLQISVKVEPPHKNSDLVFIPRCNTEKGEFWADVFFTPPIQPGEQIEFYITGKFPGLWDDLRTAGEDTGRVTLNKKAKMFKILVYVPYELGPFDDPIYSPHKGTCEMVEESGSRPDEKFWLFRWEIPEADPISYQFRIKKRAA